MNSSTNPFLNDDKKRLEEERKRDEEIFLQRKRLQEEERKEQHDRTVKAKIADLERTLDRKRLQLRSDKAETPSLESRIRSAKRDINASDSAEVASKERAVTTAKDDLVKIRDKEKMLLRELDEAKRSEHDIDAHLTAAERALAEEERSQEHHTQDVREEARVATARLDDKKHEAQALEEEVRRIEQDIASLKREL